jgi:hypothetical protein
MGCQIHAGPHEINTSRASWLVAEMCRPWFDQKRDTDSDGWYQDSVANSSIKAADAEVPADLNAYLMWRTDLGFEGGDDVDDEDFRHARDFIAAVAKTDFDAFLSH